MLLFYLEQKVICRLMAYFLENVGGGTFFILRRENI